MEEDFTLAVIDEHKARAEMYRAVANLLNKNADILANVSPAFAKLITAAIEEAIANKG